MSHLYFQDNKIIDTKGIQWQWAGSPSFTKESPPNYPAGLGPMAADGQYIQTALTSTALNFTGGNFFVAGLFFTKSTASDFGCILRSGTIYQIYFNGGTSAGIATDNGGFLTTEAGGLVRGSLNVVTAGRASGTNYIRLNRGNTFSQARAMTPAAGNVVVGHDSGATTGNTIVLYEMYATTTPFSAALSESVVRRVFDSFGAANAWTGP